MKSENHASNSQLGGCGSPTLGMNSEIRERCPLALNVLFHVLEGEELTKADLDGGCRTRLTFGGQYSETSRAQARLR